MGTKRPSQELSAPECLPKSKSAGRQTSKHHSVVVDWSFCRSTEFCGFAGESHCHSNLDLLLTYSFFLAINRIIAML